MGSSFSNSCCTAKVPDVHLSSYFPPQCKLSAHRFLMTYVMMLTRDVFILRAGGLRPPQAATSNSFGALVLQNCASFAWVAALHDGDRAGETQACMNSWCIAANSIRCVCMCVRVCECVNPCQTYLLAPLVRGACGWGGTQSALVGRTGMETDYSKAAQWSHSLSCECGQCLRRPTGLRWSVPARIGQACSRQHWPMALCVFIYNGTK